MRSASRGAAVLEAEGHEGHGELARSPPCGSILSATTLRSRAGRQVAGVDADVGALLAAARAARARARMRRLDRAARRERVAPPRLLEAVDQHLARRPRGRAAGTGRRARRGRRAPSRGRRSSRRRARRRRPRRARPCCPRGRTGRPASRSSRAAGCRRRSSRRPRSVAIACDLPAPEKPVMTTKSSMTALCRRRHRHLVHVVVDLARDLARQPGHRLELLAARAQEALGRAEVLQDAALARRPDAGQLVEDRARHRLVAAAAVELDREAVRLVADALEQLELGRVVRQQRAAACGPAGRPPRSASRG